MLFSNHLFIFTNLENILLLEVYFCFKRKKILKTRFNASSLLGPSKSAFIWLKILARRKNNENSLGQKEEAIYFPNCD
jgi:hypothetical protein